MSTVETIAKDVIAKFPGFVVILLVGGFAWMFGRLHKVENEDIVSLKMADVRIEAKVDGLAEDMKEVKSEIKEMRKDIDNVKLDIAGMKVDIAEIKGALQETKNDVAEIKALLLKKNP